MKKPSAQPVQSTSQPHPPKGKGKGKSRQTHAMSLSDSGSDIDSYYSDGEYYSSEGEAGDEEEFGDQFEKLCSPQTQQETPAPSGGADEKLGQLAEFFESAEKCGPDIAENLATTVNNAMRSRVSATKIDEVAELYLRPKNYVNMVVPKVNPEIWDKMSDGGQGRDLGFQKLQAQLLKTLTIQARMMDDLLKAMSTKQAVDAASCWKQAPTVSR